MIDLPGWRQTDAVVAIVFVVLGIVAIAALCVGCETVCGDELRPFPDPLFQEVATVETRSVFGDRFPETTNRQVLVQRHLYLACVDVEAKQPAWVAFRVRKQDWDTEQQLARNFTTPRELRDICLEPGDYNKSGYEKGHMYALQLASGSQYGHEVNQLCAVAAQRPGLNKGPWLDAENRIKKASDRETVSVLSGQLWLLDMPTLRRANEPHKVASHCWIMWSVGGVEEAYLMPQSATTKDELEQFRIDPQELREKVSRRWVGVK
jgi:DNA/RNA endonuclease G (NUC1)